jgi:hypothetical protein
MYYQLPLFNTVVLQDCFLWQFLSKEILAYKSIRVITGRKPQVSLLYNVALHSTLSGGPSCILHRFADMDNGTGDQNHRIPHNSNPDVASVIASCRRGHECRGDQSTKRVKYRRKIRMICCARNVGFWDVGPRILVVMYPSLGGICCLDILP